MFVCAALLVHIHLALVHVYGTARAHHGGTMEEVNPCPIFWGRGVKKHQKLHSFKAFRSC